MTRAAMTRSHYLMIGGFLGAGKTTAILKLARLLRSRGLRTGLITNDQSVGLVDTAVVPTDLFPAEEITAGRFCFRFHTPMDAPHKLSPVDCPLGVNARQLQERVRRKDLRARRRGARRVARPHPAGRSASHHSDGSGLRNLCRRRSAARMVERLSLAARIRRNRRQRTIEETR